MKAVASLFALAFATQASAKLYNWSIDWVRAAPDGFERPVIGINGQWPCPALEAEVGETVTIVMYNNLGNETTSLHFHGISQMRSNSMDGPVAVTQCPVPPGSTFTYTWTADAPGTFWYHSHSGAQYPDGLRGPLIITDPNNPAPYASKISKEYILTVTEWYHDEMPGLIHAYQSADTNGAEPVPWSGLINDKATDSFDMVPGETYLFRIINIGSFPSFFIGFEGHNMTIVELDSIYTEPTLATTLYVGAAQRYGVLITANADPSRNYGIISAFDTTMFKTPSPNAQFRNATFGTLSYSASAGAAKPFPPVMPPIDDITVLPLDGQPLLGPVDKQIVLDFNFTKINGVQRAIVNEVTYLPQQVPTLYTALSIGEDNVTDATPYGQVNPFFAEYGQIVEIVINNNDNNGHPWHLHGHQFQVVARSAGNVLPAKVYDASQAAPVPMRRDVAGVRGGGYTAIRFRADNPGVQFLHCHIEWHIEAGLIVTLIEAPELLYGGTSSDGKQWDPLVIPQDHLAACKKAGLPGSGNAAGNTVNFGDLSGAMTVPSNNNWGASWIPPMQSSTATSSGASASAPANGSSISSGASAKPTGPSQLGPGGYGGASSSASLSTSTTSGSALGGNAGSPPAATSTAEAGGSWGSNASPGYAVPGNGSSPAGSAGNGVVGPTKTGPAGSAYTGAASALEVSALGFAGLIGLVACVL